MLSAMNKYSQFEAMKKVLIGVLLLYSIVVTFAYIRNEPKLTVISIEESGTYLVTENTPARAKAEKVKFITSFLRHFYDYDETNFDERISYVGDMMIGSLWEQKKEEFKRISDRLKTEPVSVRSELRDVRQIDDHHFEADLKILVQKRLQKIEQQYRVTIEVRETARTEKNPYPFQVVSYGEQTN